jgi:hypothetical protein
LRKLKLITLEMNSDMRNIDNKNKYSSKEKKFRQDFQRENPLGEMGNRGDLFDMKNIMNAS